VGDVIHRQPTPQEIKEKKRYAWLKELAKDPAAAHLEWKRLTDLERVFYGYGSGFPEHTPEWFQARGFKLQWRSSKDVLVPYEFWVHPSGTIIMQMLEQKKDTPTPTVQSSEVPASEKSETPVGTTSSASGRKAILPSWATPIEGNLKSMKAKLINMSKTIDYPTDKNYRKEYDKYDRFLKETYDGLKKAVENFQPVSAADEEYQNLLKLKAWVYYESVLFWRNVDIPSPYLQGVSPPPTKIKP
jgi:hypothetical protein